MKRSALTPVLLTATLLGTAAPLAAQDSTAHESRVVDRLDFWQADEVLVTRHGDMVLLLDDSDLVLQLTDRGLDDIRPEPSEDESLADRLIGAMVGAGLRELLDNAMAIPIAAIGRAEVIGDRLVLEGHDGDELFQIEVNGREVAEDFAPAEAREFARRLRARMARHGG